VTIAPKLHQTCILNTKQQVGYLMSINNVNTTFYLIWQIKYLVAKLCIEHAAFAFSQVLVMSPPCWEGFGPD
jgi:hypothetical protein